MDDNEVFLNWILNCPNLTYLFSLFGTVSDGARHMVRMPDGVVSRTEYIDGSVGVVRYNDYSIMLYDSACVEWQPPDDSENLTEYANAQAIIDWCIAQNRAGNLPEFADREVERVEAATSNPTIAGIDENGIAKYMITIRVVFAEVIE